ncbi:MAG: hypothetical protein ACTSPY_14935 [Candidatus Helarchaeota archaeon]
MITIKEANELITYASGIFDKLFASRFLIESVLFPVSEYILVACINSYEKFYNQLKELVKKISVDEIIERERGKLFTEITPLQIFNIQMFPLFGRMCRISNRYHDDPLKEPEEKFDQIRFILTFWKELASKYYNGHLTVEEMGGKCQIATDESLRIITDRLRKSDDGNELNQIKKTVAQLEQISFLDECETRMKISNHGPYYISSNELITVHEIVRLYDGKKPQWPWSETNATAPYSNFLIAYLLEGDVQCYYNDWGTMISNPIDFKSHIKKYCILSRKGNKYIELKHDDIKDFEKYAKEAHKELYLKFSKWTKKERLEAGILVYNKNFDRFTNLVGITDKLDWGIAEEVRDQEFKRLLNNDTSDFRVGNWMMRSNRKRKIMPTYFRREQVNLKEIGSFYK